MPTYRSGWWWVMLVAALAMTSIVLSDWTAHAEPAPSCFEDDCPVWDCTRDGNRLCGPLPDFESASLVPYGVPSATGRSSRWTLVCRSRIRSAR